MGRDHPSRPATRRPRSAPARGQVRRGRTSLQTCSAPGPERRARSCAARLHRATVQPVRGRGEVPHQGRHARPGRQPLPDAPRGLRCAPGPACPGGRPTARLGQPVRSGACRPLRQYERPAVAGTRPRQHEGAVHRAGPAAVHPGPGERRAVAELRPGHRCHVSGHVEGRGGRAWPAGGVERFDRGPRPHLNPVSGCPGLAHHRRHRAAQPADPLERIPHADHAGRHTDGRLDRYHAVLSLPDHHGLRQPGAGVAAQDKGATAPVPGRSATRSCGEAAAVVGR
jgi:hypothetical protein